MRIPLLAVALLACAATSAEESLPERVRACAALTGESARLACYDRAAAALASWRTMSADVRLLLKVGDTVTLSRGAFGSFRLATPGGRIARVNRLR